MTAMMTAMLGKVIGLKGLVVGMLLLAPTIVAAQTDPSSTPTTNPQTTPGSSGSQTTPGVRRGTATSDPEGRENGGGGADAQGMKDKMFLRKAAQGGLAEIKLGGLAAEKGNSDDVKQFGRKMVTDHTRLNETMKPIAESMSVVLPTKLSKMDQAEYDKLNAMSGDDFDKEYLAYMTTDHHHDLKEFENEAESGGDPALKDAAANGLKVIARHTRMVEKLDVAHGVK